jgi:hypothetical protein
MVMVVVFQKNYQGSFEFESCHMGYHIGCHMGCHMC